MNLRLGFGDLGYGYFFDKLPRILYNLLVCRCPKLLDSRFESGMIDGVVNANYLGLSRGPCYFSCSWCFPTQQNKQGPLDKATTVNYPTIQYYTCIGHQ